MRTTEPLSPSHWPGATAPGGAPPSPSQTATWSDVVDDLVPVIEVIPVYGPPIVLVFAPWLLLGLMLSGPFAVLVVFVALAVVAAVLLAALAGIVATPYLIVRGLRRRHRASHAIAVAGTPVAHLDAQRVVA